MTYRELKAYKKIAEKKYKKDKDFFKKQKRIEEYIEEE